MESAMGRFSIEDRSEVMIDLGRIEDMADRPSELDSILRRHHDDSFVVSLNRARLRENRNAKPALLIAFKSQSHFFERTSHC